MSILVTAPAFLSFLLLGAHYVHRGAPLLAVLCVALCALLFSANRAVIRIAQVVLALAAVEWVLTTYEIMQERQVEHREWVRAAMILLGVAVFNLLAAGVLRYRRRV